MKRRTQAENAADRALLGTPPDAPPVTVAALSFDGPSPPTLAEALRGALERRLKHLAGCYARELRITPSLQGTLTAVWTIDAQGAAKDHRLSQRGLTPADGASAEEVQRCALTQLRAVRGPRPASPVRVEVTLRFDNTLERWWREIPVADANAATPRQGG